MRVALWRSGTVLYSDNHLASPVAGNQDALGVLRYLKDSDHDVCIFGAAKGAFDVPVFNVDMRGLDDVSSPEEFHQRTDAAIEELRAWKPDCLLNVAGASPTISDPGNPWGVGTLMWATRTVFPGLKACHVLDVPRHVIINDPRNYPKDHEMHYWPRAIPASLMSQRTSTFKRIVRGKQIEYNEVYSRCENWWSYGMLRRVGLPTQKKPVVLAHAHFGDARVSKNGTREQCWREVLGAAITPPDIIGSGWGETEWKNQWRGIVKHDEVQEILSQYECGPMLPIESDFLTGKLREYALAGCLPRPIVSNTHTYDINEVYVPIDHHTRIRAGESWDSMSDDSWIDHLLEVTTPNFDALERVLAGEKIGGAQWCA